MKQLLQLLLIILVSLPLQAQMPNSSKKLVLGLGAGTYNADNISGVSGIFDLTHEEKTHFYKLRFIANREVNLSPFREEEEDHSMEIGALIGWLSNGRNFKVALSTGAAVVTGQEVYKHGKIHKYTLVSVPAQVEARIKFSSTRNLGIGYALNLNKEQSFSVFFIKLNFIS